MVAIAATASAETVAMAVAETVAVAVMTAAVAAITMAIILLTTGTNGTHYDRSLINCTIDFVFLSPTGLPSALSHPLVDRCLKNNLSFMIRARVRKKISAGLGNETVLFEIRT